VLPPPPALPEQPPQVPTNDGTAFQYHGTNRNGMLITFNEPSACTRVYANVRVQVELNISCVSRFGFFFVCLTVSLHDQVRLL